MMGRGNNQFVSPTTSRLNVIRNGHTITRSAGIPKPVVVIDTCEQEPFPLYANHSNWIDGETRSDLETGNYTVQGMEHLLALERKSLADIFECTVKYRVGFIAECERLSHFRWKTILIESTFEDVKASVPPTEFLGAHPNGVFGTLDAIEAKFGIPVRYSSMHRDLATECAASWLSKHFTYWWLEEHGYDRVLIDSDRL
jgi:ERCC4-type nuclease